MEDITDADYVNAKRVSKDFEIKNLGEYHYLYVQSNALLLADVFENFRNMCLEITVAYMCHKTFPPILNLLRKQITVWEILTVNLLLITDNFLL